MRSLLLAAASLLSLTPSVLSAVSKPSPKRGLCHVPSDNHPGDDAIWTTTPGSDITWYYNYKSEPSASFLSDDNLQFVPMLWGASEGEAGTPFLDSVKAQLKSGKNISYVLGFNEPDGTSATGGSGVPAELAASTWKAQIEPLKELGIQLGAPAVTGGEEGWAWLENFYNACDGGCNPDFVPVHWYGNFEGMASHVGQHMEKSPGKKIWVTEWGYPNMELAETQDFFNMSVEWFDKMENVTHYSYFGAFRSDVSNVGNNAAMLTEKGQLTDIGSWYLGGAATGNIPQKTGGAASVVRFAGWSLAVIVSGIWTLL